MRLSDYRGIFYRCILLNLATGSIKVFCVYVCLECCQYVVNWLCSVVVMASLL